MELRHLRHFVVVAETLHMGRAAQRLGMAQPPLSQSIARLERELGVKLFERAHRRLALTRAGASLLPEARRTLQDAEAARAVARGAGTGTAGDVRIGFVSAALYELLPSLVVSLRQEFPMIRPVLTEMATNEQVAALAEGTIDFGICHPPLGSSERLDIIPVADETLIAAIPEDGRTGPVTIAELARMGLVLFPAAQGPSLHASILNAFAEAGHDVSIQQPATRALTMLSLVAAGVGAALLPRSTERISFKGVRFAPIKGLQLPALPVAAIARRRPRPLIVETVLGVFNHSLEAGTGEENRLGANKLTTA
ncbi:LysR family transcriptional regulator [Sinorhizobium meliloti]|uniref:LysR family transcriptional regulator n=1 Tax=Rhizobium meliloti TaxID=382 RepID=UPI00299E4459|nr:LysR family transcriptional regulator [Sinorhizobium meliloti]MDW9691953.1 LysR family transcriptional regulator [Sinorhizobium meliloti]MDW9717083.1 LysR family transcriptional regulator [Sinorhizobium meliloti]MDW9754258.1 LysR family transcriptional regulator [Sinorhizobium meliloti]